ncbi:unnamed protein product [Eruca vesicaria subsp. sativa]|uniref:GIR1-like zinc ribbon domain-containing protein n=1 Tax=Eruca vesicaria subsp. sativa TaxID=29727 RepID=A0ABC8JC55_ERUVS|nr:unnamed protein product [Eruca vesicaria subsp. sativa]
MTADVSYIVRKLSRYNEDRMTVKDSSGEGSSVALMTRDLLGSAGCGGGVGGDDHSLELDLDLQVPNGWEKRLDLKSGKVYLQQSNSTTSSTHIVRSDQSNQTVPRFQDLNYPPVSGKSTARPLLSLFDADTSLELKLVPSSSSSSSPSSSNLSLPSSSFSFQSVCTLDKVKSALERVGKDSSVMIKKRKSPEDGVCDGNATAAASSPVAVGCPRCLSYVLVMKDNPKCPRCHSFVPLTAMKKHKIDLNICI